MKFDEMSEWWNAAARNNAMTAILSNNRDWDETEFFQSGEAWLESDLTFARMARVAPAGESVLDFGCGLGRMTSALAKYFESAVGVDLSHEMIERATELKGSKEIRFVQSGEAPLEF